MSPHLQSITAGVLVTVAAAWLAGRYLAGRKRPGCGGDCGCPSTEIRSKLGKR